jgi:hypothetical protein
MSQLIICERTGFWATKFRQICGGAGLQVVEQPVLTQLDPAQLSRSLLAIELLENNVSQVVSLLSDWQRGDESLRWVALIDRSFKVCESQVRQLGFIDVYSEPLELRRLARLTRRHFSLFPEQPQSAVDAILASCWDHGNYGTN